jgi:hypothetical protein
MAMKIKKVMSADVPGSPPLDYHPLRASGARGNP